MACPMSPGLMTATVRIVSLMGPTIAPRGPRRPGTGQPPDTAGMIRTSEPAPTGVSSPARSSST
jgi:hypothetical protein